MRRVPIDINWLLSEVKRSSAHTCVLGWWDGRVVSYKEATQKKQFSIDVAFLAA
jgi:hypothetical protein